jgi:hypothetical protein
MNPKITSSFHSDSDGRILEVIFMINIFQSRGRLILATSLTTLLATSCTASFAWGGFAANHPRRAEVLGRDNHINNRINNDRGQLGGHYGQLKSEDRAIRQQEQADARFNGGHITKGEQNQLNHEENHVNNQIRRDYTGSATGGGGNPGGGNFATNHPRRAEVLGRDNGLNNQIQADRGNLDGHYNQLNREDSSIHQQEQADARYNGGYITKGEQNQLNREENRVQNQIKRDVQ